MTRRFFLALALASIPASAADFPTVDLSNSRVHAKILLPNPQTGYYRGTRFDWSGAIASLEWNGHSYFGQWFEKYDPKIHDAITGPVEEFFGNLGYDEVKVGESFVKIGVGALKKPVEPRYRQFSTYDIVDPGRWTVTHGKDWVEFVHELRDTAGYSYRYTKKLRLAKHKPGFVLDHHLQNTGRKAIASSVYQHDFFTLDGQLTGPEFIVKFRFNPRTKADLRGLAEIRGKDLVYLQDLQKGQTAAGEFEGFSNSVKDYDIRVENRSTGAGIRQTGDRPMSKVYFWSIRTTVCPEAYVDLKVPPGKAVSWRINYELYSLPTQNKIR